MNVLYDWVDKDEPDDKTFSPSRTLKLLLAILAAGFVGGLPAGVAFLAAHQAEKAEQERKREEDIRRLVRDVQAAHEAGEVVGEAALRLFGLDQQPARNPMPPNNEFVNEH